MAAYVIYFLIMLILDLVLINNSARETRRIDKLINTIMVAFISFVLGAVLIKLVT